MNQISIRKKSFADYKAVIFDLDGTLYYQRPFRLRMLIFLAAYMIRHPSAIKDMMIIRKYREVREKWEACDNKCSHRGSDTQLGLEDQQYQYVADEMKVEYARVKKAVTFFMLEAPLKLLPPYKDSVLSEWIEELHKNNKTVVVYSDYPVEKKLQALGIRADACYTSSDPRINCMKPDPKGLCMILEDIGCPACDALMVGDRYEKDGLAAKGNDVDYIIVSKSGKERQKLRAIYGQ